MSGVAALGLAYAKQQHRHFTSEEYRELLYTTARNIDEHFVGEKLFYMNHTSAGAVPVKMNLADYRGKMGRLTDAGALLKAIDGSGRDMRLPNVYLAPESTTTLNLADYTTESVTSATITNENIAEATLSNAMLTIRAKSVGQTSYTLHTSNGKELRATITVREDAADNGWL